MDRQLNREMFHSLRLDRRRLLSEGFTWEWPHQFQLAAAGETVFSITVAAEPVLVTGPYLTTTGTRGVIFEGYAGGDVIPGIPLQGFPLNHSRPKSAPLDQYTVGATVNVEGTQIAERILGETLAFGDLEDIILSESIGYYLRVTNLHNQAADLTIVMFFAAIGEPPPGF